MGASAPLILPRAALSVALLGAASLYVFVLKFFDDAPPVARDERTALGMCVAATFCVRARAARRRRRVRGNPPHACAPLPRALRRTCWSCSTT